MVQRRARRSHWEWRSGWGGKPGHARSQVSGKATKRKRVLQKVCRTIFLWVSRRASLPCGWEVARRSRHRSLKCPVDHLQEPGCWRKTVVGPTHVRDFSMVIPVGFYHDEKHAAHGREYTTYHYWTLNTWNTSRMWGQPESKSGLALHQTVGDNAWRLSQVFTKPHLPWLGHSSSHMQTQTSHIVFYSVARTHHSDI